VGALYDIRRIGQLVCVVIASFSTLGKAAGIAGIINQTDGKELELVL